MDEAAERINTVVYKFTLNDTHLVHPCHSFVIQKQKRARNTHWENYKMDAVPKGKWKDGSVVLLNSGKYFFFRLAAHVVHEMKYQRDEDGLPYARKAMILMGMGLNTHGM